MQITWHGHACFTIKGKDTTVVVDPFDAKEIGLKAPSLKADLVLVTRDFPAHNAVSQVAGDPKVIDWPGEYEIGGVLIRGVQIPTEDGEERTIYLLTVDDISVCHLGDLNKPLTSKMCDDLSDTDVLLIPVGGGPTLKPKQAREVAEQIDPRIVVPMHYSIEGYSSGYELMPLTDFKKEMGVANGEPEDTMKLKRSDLIQQDLHVKILNAQS